MSNHSAKAYGRDVMDFVRHMHAQGVDPLHVTADHFKLYKRALHEAGMTTATVVRRLSVLRGAYRQLPAKGLVSWETAQDIAAIKAASVQKNSMPSLTQKQAIAQSYRDQLAYGGHSAPVVLESTPILRLGRDSTSRPLLRRRPSQLQRGRRAGSARPRPRL
jgi:site-specific recombinase XerC